jgi:uncharacterized protein with beta-barrel porin domain
MHTRAFLASGRWRSAVLVLAALLIGALAGPGAVSSAGQAISKVLVTNTPDNPVPVVGDLTVAEGPTTLIASGSTSLGAGASAVVADALDVSGYRTVRIVAEASQHVNYEILSGSIHLDQHNEQVRLSEVYEVPGSVLSFKVTEVDGVAQTVVWAIYGR